MDPIVWHIGDVIRKHRERLGLKQHDLAVRADVRPNTLGNLERLGGRYEPETLQKVLAVLGLTEAEAFALVPSTTSPVTPSIENAIDDVTWARYRRLPDSAKASVQKVIESLADAHSVDVPSRGNEKPNASAPPGNLTGTQ